MKDAAHALVRSEPELAGLCVALGAADAGGWSAHERALATRAPAPAASTVAAARDAIRAGGDPLGESFCALRSPVDRRANGATYTPGSIVGAMIDWAGSAADPARVVDPGTGSGRFLVAAGRAFPRATLVGIDVDPLAALTCRANLAAAGLAARAEIRVCDYRRAELAPIAGTTLFTGNPPYVRHHDIAAEWKQWLTTTARARGFAASQLAGLHVHFFLATLERARPGDIGVFVTAAEWLDVNYGQLVRDLLAGPLGVVRIDIVEPQSPVFGDALTTAAITSFRPGAPPATVHLRRVASPAALAPLSGGRAVPASVLASTRRWSPLSRRQPRVQERLVELGELCRVHRGQVTGTNDVWIAAPDAPPLPARFRIPAITRARELFTAGSTLTSVEQLRHVIDLPVDLDSLDGDDRRVVDRFLRWARRRGAHASYVARHRTPWWSVNLRSPAPILATYMARRPPAFVRNIAGARHINIAHGIYPRAPIEPACLDALAEHLRHSASLTDGRTYAGGLTKFEPREMERLLVPDLDALRR